MAKILLMNAQNLSKINREYIKIYLFYFSLAADHQKFVLKIIEIP